MGAYFLFPVYYGIFQCLEGLGLVLAFRVYRQMYYDPTHQVAQSRVTYEKFDDDLDADVGLEDSGMRGMRVSMATEGSEGYAAEGNGEKQKILYSGE